MITEFIKLNKIQKALYLVIIHSLGKKISKNILYTMKYSISSEKQTYNKNSVTCVKRQMVKKQRNVTASHHVRAVYRDDLSY